MAKPKPEVTLIKTSVFLHPDVLARTKAHAGAAGVSVTKFIAGLVGKKVASPVK